MRTSPKNPLTPIRVGLFAILAFFFFCSLLVLSAGGFFLYFQVSDRIVPGVAVGAHNLGGKRITEAALELNTDWNLDKVIVVTNGIETMTIHPQQLGLRLDALSTVQRAYAVGHSDSRLDNLGQMLVSLTGGWQISPDLEYNEEEARAFLLSQTGVMSKPALDASLSIQGAQLAAIPGEIGFSINMEETLAAISANPQLLMETGILQIRLKPEAPMVQDVSPILAEAQNFLNTPAAFSAYDALSDELVDFSIPKEMLASWLTLQPGQNGPLLSLNQEKVAASLEQLGSTLGEGRFLVSEENSQALLQAVLRKEKTILSIKHHPTTYLVQPGETLLRIGWKLGIPYWMIVRANPDINPDQLVSGSQLVIPSKDELTPLPAVRNKRIIISIPKQRLWVVQDGKEIAEHVVSTGIDKSPTQPGIFQVRSHEKNAYASAWDLHMPNFLGIYEAWPGFMNGIHGLPTLSNGTRLWANVLGRKASYGCIILDLDTAKWLYDWAEEGVIVEIRS